MSDSTQPSQEPNQPDNPELEQPVQEPAVPKRAGKGKFVSAREAVALLIAQGWTQQKAGAKVGVAPRTVNKWCNHDDGFKALVRSIRKGITDRVAGRLSRHGQYAANRLRGLAASTTEAVACQASKAILEIGLKVRQLEAVEDEIARQAEHLKANDEKIARLEGIIARQAVELASVPLPVQGDEAGEAGTEPSVGEIVDPGASGAAQ